jgi:pyruvate ferredoxin oxidoreductase delta subunit
MNEVKGVNLDLRWDEVSVAGNVLGGGTSKAVPTGDWRVMIPTFFADKCSQCLLCFPVCADAAITVKDGKREDFDFNHCKGCGVCYKVCPLKDKAIIWEKEDK